MPVCAESGYSAGGAAALVTKDCISVFKAKMGAKHSHGLVGIVLGCQRRARHETDSTSSKSQLEWPNEAQLSKTLELLQGCHEGVVYGFFQFSRSQLNLVLGKWF